MKLALYEQDKGKSTNTHNPRWLNLKEIFPMIQRITFKHHLTKARITVPYNHYVTNSQERTFYFELEDFKKLENFSRSQLESYEAHGRDQEEKT